MSIKKLFDSTNKPNNYLADTTEKDAFAEAESARNVNALNEKQDTYIPQVDYSKPEHFVKYGSAYLYYKSAIERVLDFFPYDGSDAEINEFYNKSLDIEKYIFDNLYPRRNGYAVLCSDGWGTLDGSLKSGYGLPSTLEHITLYGGPNTVTATTTAKLFQNPKSSKTDFANIYDTDIYTTAGLPTNYGSGSRESNLKSDFDTGVTAEFWLKTGSLSDALTEKQVVFDMWNNVASSSAGYGRLTIALTASTAATATITLDDTIDAGSMDYGQTIQIISTDGTTRTYTARAASDFANNEFDADGGFDDKAAALKSAIEHSSGHNGKITVTQGGAGDAVLTLKQVTHGTAGNTTITENLSDCTATNFTGGNSSPFLVTAQSGTTGIFEQSIGNDITVGSLSDWKHYGLALYNSGSKFIVKLYVDGQLNDTNTYSNTLNEINSKDMAGRVGALLTAPSASNGALGVASTMVGSGKLSGSIDEFRFWKVRRNSQEIAKNWFTHIRGGVNTDISNTTLGVYYKFNEGITQTSSVDSIVLDYSGRVSNGTWTGYASTSRNTGSAIISASAATVEYEDPVVRSSHPDVVSLKSRLMTSGSNHDYTNVSSMLGLLPSWIAEEHESSEDGNLQVLCHIVGTYFDKLHLLISQLSRFRGQTYTSSSYKPLPFAQHMPQSLGLYTPDIFIDSDVLERFMNRNQTMLFDSDLNDMKNMIYLNLYNNLSYIYKSKGTERAIRNVLRCFNLDEKLIKFNVYSNDQTYELQNKLVQTLVKKKSANFNTVTNITGVVYQAQDSSNSDSLGYISGSQTNGYEDKHGFTVESDIFFPSFKKESDSFDRNDTDISLFGMHTVDTGSAASLNGTTTTWVDLDYANFQVLAIRDSEYSKNVHFKLTSSNSPNLIPELTSSTFLSVYDNDRWNLSVRIKPSNYPQTDMVTGSDVYTYDVIFRGVNTILDTVQDSFMLTASLSKANGRKILRSAKRLYAGSRKTNITGGILQKSDVLISNVRYWTKYIDDMDLNQHIFDIENRGVSGSYKEISPKDPNDKNIEVLNLNTLALDWSFDNVTSSNTDGTFNVTDMSSGSAFVRSNYGWMGNITGYQLTGKGQDFAGSSDRAISEDVINTYKFVNPERVISSDMIQVLTEDEKLFGITEIVPNYYFSLEKSMHAAISEEMLKFFAGVIDFNNIIGEPVNRYRSRYKALEKLREIFFRKVTEVKDVEKYLDYYKWFDESLTDIIEQLVPATSVYASDVLNIVESHVLERPKYKTQFPTLEFQPSDPEAPLVGIMEKTYADSPPMAWSSPLPSSSATELRSTRVHEDYWDERAESDAPEITSGDSTIDDQRGTVRQVKNTVPTLSQSRPTLSTTSGVRYTHGRDWLLRNFPKPYKFDLQKSIVFKGGVNFNENKNIHFTYNALYPAGPVNQDGGRFVPLNVLIGHDTDFVGLKETYKEAQTIHPSKKTKRRLKVEHGRDWQDGLGYSNRKSSFGYPFNIVSSSVTTGYNKRVVERLSASLQITNLHNDVYGDDMEVPMQGAFTNYAVGGHQSRHIKLNTGVDDYMTRPEAWKILLGRCVGYVPGSTASGSIGMVGPDYPHPEANATGAVPYPMTASQKAVYYRDKIAKSPVNIRNIHHTTGAGPDSLSLTVPNLAKFTDPELMPGKLITILGNYNQQYDIVNSVGAYATPRRFVDQRPIWTSSVDVKKANVFNNITNLHRGDEEHFNFQLTYAPTQFTGSGNRTIIVNRFSAPGGPEVMSRGFQDIRGSEFSPYNNLNYRHLTVIKPSQGPSGSQSEATGSGIPGIRVSDIHTKDYGLRSHLARHTARFGRDSLWVTGTTAVIDGPESTAGGPGASYNQRPGFHKVHRNATTIKRNKRTVVTLASMTNTVVSERQRDNFFVQHQIPRRDKNYSWITASLHTSSLGNLKYQRFAAGQNTIDGFYSTSAGYVSFYDFVTASEVGNAGDGGGTWTTPGYPSMGSIYQPAMINLRCVDPVSGSPHNTLGYPVAGPLGTQRWQTQYVGEAPLTPQNSATSFVNYFNLLMFRRRDNYTWSWRKNRQSDNPIINKERQENKLSAVLPGKNNESINSYRLPPLSMKGRPTLVNIQVDRTNDVTLRATNNNEKIYYNEQEINERVVGEAINYIVTPYDEVMATIKQKDYTLNWVVYSEALYPQLYNEFYTSSVNRVGYNNYYWRTNRANRDGNAADAKNSFDIPDISQSSWILDPQTDFLTRANPSLAANETLPAATETSFNALKRSGSSGELQNDYFFAFPTEPWRAITPTTKQKIKSLWPAALYARKHMLSHPYSVVARSGIHIPEIAGISKSNDAKEYLFFNNNYGIDIFGGEALWEAGSLAGIIVKDTTTEKTAVFESHSSEPWFDKYTDFNHDLRLIAKDYAIVPEFRISQHIADYVRYGLFNKEKTDTFEIPGTGINSSNTTFYKDYSNSDFMNNFIQVKEETSLSAKEIKLVCKAAIRFNPYKGFYPAQRTLDLVKEFNSSYGGGYYATGSTVFVKQTSGPTYPFEAGNRPPDSPEIPKLLGGALRPVIQPLFAPGILYNSIKSGIAVDYPIITDIYRVEKSPFGNTKAATNPEPNWAITCKTGYTFPSQGTSGKAGDSQGGSDSFDAPGGKVGWDGSGSFFNERMPFETILDPGKNMFDVLIPDIEPHPSAALDVTASLSNTQVDGVYSKMANNFFGEVGNFFLKDGTFSKLESGVVTDDLRFSSGSVYGARLKIRRSTTGLRTYENESSSFGSNLGYAKFGGALYSGSSAVNKYFYHESYYPIPQDPRQNNEFKESFTMYSRPSAFGPPLAGRPAATKADDTYVINRSPVDCFNGFNWAYTPPYYHGEAWVDFIFRPDHTKKYDLDQILSEMDLVYWRCDAGPVSASSSTFGRKGRVLIVDYTGSDYNSDGVRLRTPYQGRTVNDNAMQLSASVNLFGVESVPVQEVDNFGNLISTKNETAGKRWVIQPKFETPMLDFGDQSARPIRAASSTITMPTNFGSASVPRGMWHQFGVIPSSPNRGVFLELDDIPVNWLENHYEVVSVPSTYNNQDQHGEGKILSRKMSSLVDLLGFDDLSRAKRLGELPETRTIKEAVVAVPYLIEDVERNTVAGLSGEYRSTRKKFIDIPTERYAAAASEAMGSKAGDSLDAAGESIRKLLQKMQRYVLPPQFDFINNNSLTPIVMYIFEFEYKLDKDDLSYIWQNLAPRNYKKMALEETCVAHKLINTELLNEDNIMDNENLRWMVFKVKQRAQTDYYDQVVPQVGSANANSAFDVKSGQINPQRTEEEDNYNIAFNWPYDYLSFVEMIKFDAQVLYKEDEGKDEKTTVTTEEAEAIEAIRVLAQQK